MALSDLRALAHAYAATMGPGTRGTHQPEARGSGASDAKALAIRGDQSDGTPGTPRTRECEHAERPLATPSAANRGRQMDPLAGYMGVAMQRPPSWSDVAVIPSRGAWCSCCKGARWWTEAIAPKGWRCATCHPADHLPGSAIRQTCTGQSDDDCVQMSDVLNVSHMISEKPAHVRASDS